jgi:NitT/TauT family transport system substrate-binding protein
VKDYLRLFLAVMAACLVGAGCTPETALSTPLKVGVLPLLETLPIWVATQEGYFQSEGVVVEPVLFASAIERDAAIQARQLDGELTDLVSAALLNQGTSTVKVVRTAFVGTPNLAMISLLIPENSKIRSLSDLKGQQIAISHNSVMEYVVDQLLVSGSVDPASVQKIEVSKIPVRLEMLLQGQVAAAVLPEPLATLAVKMGARVLADDRQPKFGQSVWVFRQETLNNRADAVRRFLRAYEKATTAIAANPEKYRPLLVTKANLPDPLKDSFAVPYLPLASVPSSEDTGEVVRWMLSRGMLAAPQTYQQLVDPSLLPGK